MSGVEWISGFDNSISVVYLILDHSWHCFKSRVSLLLSFIINRDILCLCSFFHPEDPRAHSKAGSRHSPPVLHVGWFVMGFVHREPVWAFCPCGFLLTALLVTGGFPKSNGKKHRHPIQFPLSHNTSQRMVEKGGMPQGKKLMKAWFLWRAICADALANKFKSYLGRRAIPSPEMSGWCKNRLSRGLIS